MGAHTRLLVPLADITAILADPRHRELVVQEDLHPLHQQLTAGLQVIQVCPQEQLDPQAIPQIQIMAGTRHPRTVDPTVILQVLTHLVIHRHTHRPKEWGGLRINSLQVMVLPRLMVGLRLPQVPHLVLQDPILKIIMDHHDLVTHHQPLQPLGLPQQLLHQEDLQEDHLITVLMDLSLHIKISISRNPAVDPQELHQPDLQDLQHQVQHHQVHLQQQVDHHHQVMDPQLLPQGLREHPQLQGHLQELKWHLHHMA